MTTITSHRNISSGRDFTINAAIKTATMPGIAIDTDAFLLYAPSLINLTDAGGIKNSQDPIMIGNATCGDNPNAYTKAIHGAYRPIPAVFNAPNIKFTITAISSFTLLNPISTPPPLIQFILPANIKQAVTNNAKPITNLIFCSGNFDTIPAPKMAPAAADININMSVIGSTSTTVINIKAWIITGRVLVAFSVWGIM